MQTFIVFKENNIILLEKASTPQFLNVLSPENIPPQTRNELFQTISTEVKKKQELAKRTGHPFHPGDMINIQEISQDEHTVTITFTYDSEGYYQHWLTTHNEAVYSLLQRHNLVYPYKYNGLAVCVLVETVDQFLVIGSASSAASAVYTSKTLNLSGGNFQLKELFGENIPSKVTESDLRNAALLELEEEYFLTAHPDKLIPLVYANDTAFKCNPVLTYLYKYPGTMNEMRRRYLARQQLTVQSEFSELIGITPAQIHDIINKSEISFALKTALMAYQNKFSGIK